VLEIFEGLHRLLAEIAGKFTVSIEAKLPGKVNEPPRRRYLDDVTVTRRLRESFRIEETDAGAHGRPPAWGLGPPTAPPPRQTIEAGAMVA
jgi:hypothetical protein